MRAAHQQKVFNMLARYYGTHGHSKAVCINPDYRCSNYKFRIIDHCGTHDMKAIRRYAGYHKVIGTGTNRNQERTRDGA